MKHSAKKIMGLILVACLCAALTGCGREEDTTVTEAQTETDLQEEETTEKKEDDGIVNDVTNGTDTDAAEDSSADTENGAEEIGEGVGEVGEGIVDGAEDIVDGVTDDTAADDNTADDNTVADNP